MSSPKARMCRCSALTLDTATSKRSTTCNTRQCGRKKGKAHARRREKHKRTNLHDVHGGTTRHLVGKRDIPRLLVMCVCLGYLPLQGLKAWTLLVACRLGVLLGLFLLFQSTWLPFHTSTTSISPTSTTGISPTNVVTIFHEGPARGSLKCEQQAVQNAH
jgi:hypothetical protein